MPTVNAMKTTFASLLTAAALLSAGAFAGIDSRYQAQELRNANVTTVSKNQVWPVAGQITTEPCRVNKCIGV
jgi:hypothetical protein